MKGPSGRIVVRKGERDIDKKSVENTRHVSKVTLDKNMCTVKKTKEKFPYKEFRSEKLLMIQVSYFFNFTSKKVQENNFFGRRTVRVGGYVYSTK